MHKDFSSPFLLNAKGVSELFFFFFGVAYIIAYFFFSNTLFLTASTFVFHFADIPFFASALAYFFLSFRVWQEEKFFVEHLEEIMMPDFFLLDGVLIFLFVILVVGVFVGNIIFSGF